MASVTASVISSVALQWKAFNEVFCPVTPKPRASPLPQPGSLPSLCVQDEGWAGGAWVWAA